MSQLAALQILQGGVKQGIEIVLGAGDHVGYKLLGIIPALLEKGAGWSGATPAYFFAAFSVLVLWLIGRIARRLTGSARAEFLALIFAASTGSLFYFSRHVLPYDASLAFMLLSLYLGLHPRATWWRSTLAGFCAGTGFVIYYGYWTLGGLVLVVAVLSKWVRPDRRSLVDASIAVVTGLLGLALAIAIPVVIDFTWGAGTLVKGAKGLSGSIVVGDFRGLRAPWEYLWYCDHLLLFLVAGVLAAAAIRGLGGGRERVFSRWFPLCIALFGVLAVQASFFLMADILHKFAIHDRLIRQLTPFLCLVFSFTVEEFLRGGRRVNGSLTFIVLICIGCAVWNLGTPLAQEFPAQFIVRGDKLLKKLEAKETPVADSYFRYVNVLHYLFEPEVLKAKPLETLLVAPHFYNYVPYLFEAKTPEDRQARRAIDQRMRLVRMPVLPDERISGERYGAVTMTVRFVAGRRTFLEPLLSVGARSGGEVFFVHFLDDKVITFGFFSWDYSVFESEPMSIDLNQDHEVMLFSSSMLSEAHADPNSKLAGPALSIDKEHPCLVVEFDHRRVFEHTIVPKQVRPEQVYAGVNAVQADYALSQFSGKISHVVRTAEFPLLGTLHPRRLTLGAETLVVDLQPLTHGDGKPEPIAVFGATGKSVFVFMRTQPNGKVKVGAEIWGIGAWESPAIEINGKPLHLACDLGPLLPPVGSSEWRNVPPARQAELRGKIVLRCNGETVVDVPVGAIEGFTAAGYLGTSPVGGSLVYPWFSGQIKSLSTEPFR
ncbi:MAG TPA: hypothetical protein VFT72_08160 [Opitutaceae bacterium]|nr:hypothetical protein [Opitutaceae bacterium]